MRRTAALLPVLLLVLAGACSDGDETTIVDGVPVTEPPEVVELTTSGGCGDAWFWVASDDGTVALTVGVEVPRHSTREPVVVEVDLSGPDADAELLRGDGDLRRNFCVDVLDEEGEADERVDVVEGTGTVTIDPIPTDVSLCGSATGRVELTDVVAEDGTRFASVTGETDAIGCYAG